MDNHGQARQWKCGKLNEIQCGSHETAPTALTSARGMCSHRGDLRKLQFTHVLLANDQTVTASTRGSRPGRDVILFVLPLVLLLLRSGRCGALAQV